MFGGQAWISQGTDHLASELGEVKPTVMNSVPRVYEKMHAAAMARVRESPAIRRLIFSWAIAAGTRFSHEPNPGPQLRWQRKLATALGLADLRKSPPGGCSRFYVRAWR